VKYWEIILENLRNAGWNCGSMATTDGKRRPIWVVAAERSDAGRLLCMQIKSCLPFSNSNPQFKPSDIIMSAIARNRMKNWEVIAHNLSKAGWSWGCVSAIDSNGRTIWIVDAHRDDGKRFVVRADEKLTAFLELESAIRAADTHDYATNQEIALAMPRVAATPLAKIKAAGTQQPIALPTLRCRPARVSGTPSLRDSLALALDKPVARFHENETPGMPFLRPMMISLCAPN
jgi:hypothetical protein